MPKHHEKALVGVDQTCVSSKFMYGICFVGSFFFGGGGYWVFLFDKIFISLMISPPRCLGRLL